MNLQARRIKDLEGENRKLHQTLCDVSLWLGECNGRVLSESWKVSPDSTWLDFSLMLQQFPFGAVFGSRHDEVRQRYLNAFSDLDEKIDAETERRKEVQYRELAEEYGDYPFRYEIEKL